MALTAKQRKALPDSAFAYPSKRSFPVPTRAQARKAGISERQRLAVHRNALSRAAQPQTRGSYPAVARKVKARAGAKVATVGGPRGTTSRPGFRKVSARRTTRKRLPPRTAKGRFRRRR
jgi:hypothetical protein